MAAGDAELVRSQIIPCRLALNTSRQALRHLASEDLFAVLDTEAECYPNPWSRKTFEDCLAAEAKGYHCYALICSEVMVGHCVFTVIANEAQLLNFCLAPAHQGRGLAREFLEQVLADMTDRGGASIFLEVRESNAAAISLYQGSGFCEIGRRKGYYPHEQGREDALLLERPARL